MIAPRCICGRGRMKIKCTITAIFDVDGNKEYTHCTWQGFCPECGALTPYQGSVNDAIDAFKACDYDWYNDEGWGYDD